jgi:hypothetical protein
MPGLLQDCDAATAPGAAGNVRSLRQAAEIKKDFEKAGTIFEIHIDKFKCHGLRTCTADDGLGFDSANALRQF